MFAWLKNLGPMLIGALAMGLESLIWRAVGILGFGFTTYTGVGVFLDGIRDKVISSISGQSADIVNLIGFFWLDKGITIIFSAYAMVFAFRSLDGVVRKFGPVSAKVGP